MSRATPEKFVHGALSLIMGQPAAEPRALPILPLSPVCPNMPQFPGYWSRFWGHSALPLSKISLRSYWRRTALLAESRVTRRRGNHHARAGYLRRPDDEPGGQLRDVDDLRRDGARTAEQRGDAAERAELDRDLGRAGLGDRRVDAPDAGVRLNGVRALGRVRGKADRVQARDADRIPQVGVERLIGDRRLAGDVVDRRAVERGVGVHARGPGGEVDGELAAGGRDVVRADVDRLDVVRGDLGEERPALDVDRRLGVEPRRLDLLGDAVLRDRLGDLV